MLNHSVYKTLKILTRVDLRSVRSPLAATGEWRGDRRRKVSEQTGVEVTIDASGGRRCEVSYVHHELKIGVDKIVRTVFHGDCQRQSKTHDRAVMKLCDILKEYVEVWGSL